MQQLHHKLVNNFYFFYFAVLCGRWRALGMVAGWLGDVGEWGEK